MEPYEQFASSEGHGAAMNQKRKMFLRFVAMALYGMAGALCTAQSAAPPKLRPEMLVTTSWLAEHLHGADLVVLCVGASAEFCGKHIPGAREIKLEEIAVMRDGIPNELPPVETLQKVFATAGVGNHSRVVLYGERSNLMAARAYFTLDYLGVAEHTALLDGGIEKWTAEHRPVSAEVVKAQSAELKIAPRKDILVDTQGMRDLAQKPNVTLLDARPTKEFSGEQLSEDVTEAGHIPGAKSLYWMDMLVSRENPVLKPEAELRQMYAAVNATADQPLVTYCRTGMQSSFDYFVAKYLGYAPSMYDASFYEWSKKGLAAEASAGK
jgi:thiosulfate/3-mercaptopyruvate sulfurtransferase